MSKKIQLRTAEDLEKLHSQPEAEFELLENLDLKGAAWMPVVLTGSLEGNGRTISNFTVAAEGAEEVGFFSVIGPEASVTDLHLADARIGA